MYVSWSLEYKYLSILLWHWSTVEATQPIVTKLFDRYFDGHISVGQTPYVSSHWDEESSYLEAVRSEDGEVRPTSVQYWGCTLDGLKAKVADKIHRYSHFPHLEK